MRVQLKLSIEIQNLKELGFVTSVSGVIIEDETSLIVLWVDFLRSSRKFFVSVGGWDPLDHGECVFHCFRKLLTTCL